MARAQQALRKGDLDLYARSMNAYNRAIQPVERTPVIGGGGGSSKVLTIVDREGTPTTRYTVMDRVVSASTVAEARAIGASSPGTYQVRNLLREDVPRANYYGFGTGVKVPVQTFRPSASPVLTTSIENVAGLGPRVISTSQTVRPASWVFGKDQVQTTKVIESRSGAQSQLMFLAAGKSQREAWNAGFGPAQMNVTTLSSQPSSTWRTARETKGWRVLTDSSMRLGNALEVQGAGIANRAGERWRDGSSALKERPLYDLGAAERFTGQFFQGLSEGIREEPGRVVVAAGIGIGTGATGKLLGTWAGFGGTGAGLANFGFKGALAFGGGYYTASEVSAVVKSDRPGARAALTALDITGFASGARVGSSFVPSPVAKGIQITSTRGVLTNDQGFPEGVLARKGAIYAKWLGKTRRLGFTTTENYFGGGVDTTVRYASGAKLSFSGRLATVSEANLGPTMTWGRIGRTVTLFEPQGVESQILNRAGQGKGAFNYRYFIAGESARTPVSGDYMGFLEKGRGYVKFNQRATLPTGGRFIFGKSEQAMVFAPGEFSGFSVGSGQFGVTLPFTETIAPAIPSVPAFASYARGLTVPQTVGFWSLPGSSSESRSMVSVSSLAVPQTLVSSSPMTLSMAIPLVTPATTSRVESLTEPVVSTLPMTVAYTSPVSLGEWGGGGGSWSEPVPFVEPPIIPFEFGPPGFGFGMGRKSWGGRGRVSFQPRYNPSLVGADFRVRGSRRSASFAALTGVAVRPVV